MSATFRHAKQKPTQQELRRLMTEQKQSSLAKSTANAGGGGAKIDSPLAKYNDAGQLQCVLCKTIVRSADVWKVHVNAKLHKQNVELAKQLKQQTNNFTNASAAPKRAATVPTVVSSSIPEKRIKGILKNSSSSSMAPPSENTAATTSTTAGKKSAIPSDFFDDAPAANSDNKLSYYEATMQKTSIRQDLLSIHRESLTTSSTNNTSMDVDTAHPLPSAVAAVDEALPEGFFDDPVKDAKARNLEYRDPVEEEWDRFQKEIKVAADTSNAIMEEDQVEATTERQIGEIDEQMRNWSR